MAAVYYYYYRRGIQRGVQVFNFYYGIMPTAYYYSPISRSGYFLDVWGWA